jgi:hypothetical protein
MGMAITATTIILIAMVTTMVHLLLLDQPIDNFITLDQTLEQLIETATRTITTTITGTTITTMTTVPTLRKYHLWMIPKPFPA